MPNTIPAAGEAMPTVSLESLVQQYKAADELVNNLPHELQDSPEEAVFHAAIDAFEDVEVTLSSYEGMMEALRLAAKETEEFATSNIARVSVTAVLTFLEERETEHPWVKARRLLKELAAHLQNCEEGKWKALVMPPIPQSFNGFGAFPMGQKPDEMAVDRVERLSWELSEALKDYQGGSFQAMVLPSNVGGHTVMLTKIAAFDRRAMA